MNLNQNGSWVASGTQFNGGKRQMTGLKAKTLRRILKKAGLKTSGKKKTLRARAKKAHLVRGGAVGLGAVQNASVAAPTTGGRHRSRRRGLFRKFF
jgi:hypothetical protein